MARRIPGGGEGIVAPSRFDFVKVRISNEHVSRGVAGACKDNFVATPVTGPRSAPRTRIAAWRIGAAVGLGIESAVLAVAAVAYGIHAFSLPEPAFAAGLAIFCALCAAGMVPVARGIARGARWAVSAALTWQAIQVLAGVNLTGVRPWLGASVATLGVAVGIAVVVGGRDAFRTASPDSQS